MGEWLNTPKSGSWRISSLHIPNSNPPPISIQSTIIECFSLAFFPVLLITREYYNVPIPAALVPFTWISNWNTSAVSFRSVIITQITITPTNPGKQREFFSEIVTVFFFYIFFFYCLVWGWKGKDIEGRPPERAAQRRLLRWAPNPRTFMLSDWMTL